MKGEERRAQLLEVGAAQFGRLGYEATGTADISRAAGIAEPTIYRHFASKEDYFLAVARHAVEELVGRIREAHPRSLDALEAFLRDEAASAPRLALLARLLEKGRHSPFREAAQEALASLEGALRGLGASGRALVLSAALLSAAGLYVEPEGWARAA
jgi:AcrR family transcriptional regulator